MAGRAKTSALDSIHEQIHYDNTKSVQLRTHWICAKQVVLLGAKDTLICRGPDLSSGPRPAKVLFRGCMTVGLLVRLLHPGFDPPRGQHTRIAIIDVENWWNALFLLRQPITAQ